MRSFHWILMGHFRWSNFSFSLALVHRACATQGYVCVCVVRLFWSGHSPLCWCAACVQTENNFMPPQSTRQTSESRLAFVVGTKSNGPQKTINSSLHAMRDPNWFSHLIPQWVRVRWTFSPNSRANVVHLRLLGQLWSVRRDNKNAARECISSFLRSNRCSVYVCLDFAFGICFHFDRANNIVMGKNAPLLLCAFNRNQSTSIWIEWNFFKVRFVCAEKNEIDTMKIE